MITEVDNLPLSRSVVYPVKLVGVSSDTMTILFDDNKYEVDIPENDTWENQALIVGMRLNIKKMNTQDGSFLFLV